MRKHLWVLVLCLLTSQVLAQSAKVVELSPTEKAEATHAYVEMKVAEQRWADLQVKLKETYKGFDAGLEFSEDFKFIVPQHQEAAPGSCWQSSGSGSLTWAACCPGSNVFTGSTSPITGTSGTFWLSTAPSPGGAGVVHY